MPAAPGLTLHTVEVDGTAYPYLLFVPPGAEPAEGWPLIVYLHGSGERGSDGFKPAAVGLAPAVFAHIDRWPAIIAIPQLPRGRRWSDLTQLPLAVVADVESRSRIDPRRRVLTGLSIGGQGTWAVASVSPDLWAGILPVCAPQGGDPAILAKLRIWAFHGEMDDVVPPSETRAMIAAIEAAGGNPRATYLPNANHNSWDAAYGDPEVARWLVTQTRPAAKEDPALSSPKPRRSSRRAMDGGGPRA
jgi:predicted peptidase